MKAILAAIDFSPVSELVIAEAASLARALAAKVVLFSALGEKPAPVNEYTSPRRGQKSIAAQERATRKRLTAIQAQLQADFVPAEINVRHGIAALQILAEADVHDTGIIVIGSHGHTAFFELLLGSTTQTVLKRAKQPVLVIPPKMPKPRRARVRVVSLSTTALPSRLYKYPPLSS